MSPPYDDSSEVFNDISNKHKDDKVNHVADPHASDKKKYRDAALNVDDDDNITDLGLEFEKHLAVTSKDQNTIRIRTLEESVAHERKHRGPKAIYTQPMPNFQECGPSGKGLPLSFEASWNLDSRPRRIALLLDDCQEEYRDYAQGILPNLMALTTVFQSARSRVEMEYGQSQADGCIQLAWSIWSRCHDDGISNAMDRWYGPRGLDPQSPQNAVYVFGGTSAVKPLTEIGPTPADIENGWCYYGRHLDMFWNFIDDPDHHPQEQDDNESGGQPQRPQVSYLDYKLKKHGIDTVVICGLWTDECVVATAYAASARGYDVIVVSDAVATATAHHQAALTVLGATVAKVVTTQEVVKYMQHAFQPGRVGAVKGTTHPDGRKE